MRTQRGSAILFVMVLIVIIGSIVLAYGSMTSVAATTETRREQAVIARLAFDGAALKASLDAGSGAINVPSSPIITVGGVTCNLTISDNSSNIQRTIAITGTASIKGRTYRDSRVEGLRIPAYPLWYVLGVNGDASYTANLTTGSGGANGDLLSNGNTRFSSPTTVNGDIESSGTINMANATLTGDTWAQAPAVSFPTFQLNDYRGSADFLLNSPFSGYSFFPLFGHDQLLYRNGALSMSGTYSGAGTVYVRGDLTLTGNVSYQFPTDHIAFIVEGNVHVTSSCTQFVGYYYALGNLITDAPTTLTRGAIACAAVQLTGAFRATYDPIIWNTPVEAAMIKLPGFWP